MTLFMHKNTVLAHHVADDIWIEFNQPRHYVVNVNVPKSLHVINPIHLQGGPVRVKFYLALFCMLRLHLESESLVHFIYVTKMM